jgi:fructokinase
MLFGGTKNPPGGRVERTQVCLRALHDKEEYVGGGEQLLHVRFLSKQPGVCDVKVIGRWWGPLNHSRAKTGGRPLTLGVVASYGSVELGGTKTSVGFGSSPDDLSSVVTIPTTHPDETLGRVIDHLASGTPDAVGIASFGPIELRREVPGYGRITVTPKEGWSRTDVVGPIREALRVPIGFDTDVNGAALGEGRWGAGRGLDTFAYVTVGTGIGGGAILEGEPLHGLGHPEMGHMTVRRHPDDRFEGTCLLHGDCVEGLASGPSIEARFGNSADRLRGEEQREAVLLEAFYLAQMIRNLVYTLAPERVIVGGGVAQMPGLLDGVSLGLLDGLSGYPGHVQHGPGFVIPPALGSLSGLAGGLILAERAIRSFG